MRKKFLKILALSSLMLTAGGVMAISQMNNRNDIHQAEAASYDLTLYNGGNTDPAGNYQIGTTNDNVIVTTKGFSYGTKGASTGFSFSGQPGANRFFGFTIPANYALTSATFTTGGGSNRNVWLGSEASKNENTIVANTTLYSSPKSKNTTQQVVNSGSQIPSGTYYVNAGGSFVIVNVTITVVSLIEPCTVSYVTNNADFEIADTNEAQGEKIAKDPGSRLDNVNHKYIEGWYKEETYTTKWDFTKDLLPAASTMSLYAKWLDIPYATFNPNGGTFEDGATENKTIYAAVEGYNVSSIVAPAVTKGDNAYTWTYVDESGTTQTATTYTNGTTYTAKWDEPVYAESITIEGGDFTFAKADIDTPKALTATIDMKDNTVNTDTTITWTSSNEKVATVDSNGNVTAVSKGEATITATIYAGTEHEKQASIKVIVPLTNLSTAVNEPLFFDCAKESEINYPDASGKESAIVDLDGQTFGGFTLHSMGTGNDTKWSGTGSNKGRSLMTNADISFVAKKEGTLTFEFATTKDTRTVILDGVTYTMDAKDTYKIVTVNNVAPGKHTLELGLSQNSSDNKIWFKYLKFEENVNTNWVDTEVHLGYQVGKMNASSEKNDSVKFVGFIAKEALDYLKDSWFEITINDGTAKATEKKTTVYSSIGYYDAAGNINEFTPNAEMGATTDFYYFAFTLTNIPSTFTGTISARAFVEDANGNSYVSAASADAQF